MIDGHGDDAYKYGQKIRINFSSNVYSHVIIMACVSIFIIGWKVFEVIPNRSLIL